MGKQELRFWGLFSLWVFTCQCIQFPALQIFIWLGGRQGEPRAVSTELCLSQGQSSSQPFWLRGCRRTRAAEMEIQGLEAHPTSLGKPFITFTPKVTKPLWDTGDVSLPRGGLVLFALPNSASSCLCTLSLHHSAPAGWEGAAPGPQPQAGCCKHNLPQNRPSLAVQDVGAISVLKEFITLLF